MVRATIRLVESVGPREARLAQSMLTVQPDGGREWPRDMDGWLGRSMCSAAASRVARNRSTTKAMLITSQTRAAETANSTSSSLATGSGQHPKVDLVPRGREALQSCAPRRRRKSCRQFFLTTFDFNERPSRNAMRLIASGERPRAFAACSSEAEDLANSMSRRSSLNDQGLRVISETILSSTQRQSRQADPCSLDGFAWVAPGLGEPGARNG